MFFSPWKVRVCVVAKLSYERDQLMCVFKTTLQYNYTVYMIKSPKLGFHEMYVLVVWPSEVPMTIVRQSYTALVLYLLTCYVTTRRLFVCVRNLRDLLASPRLPNLCVRDTHSCNLRCTCFPQPTSLGKHTHCALCFACAVLEKWAGWRFTAGSEGSFGEGER